MAIQINGKKVIQLGTAKIPVLKGDKGDIGEQGEQGIQGIPGYTPIKGVDYMTSEDRQQIADTVKADITPEITELKNGKVDKKEGYGLSQNDFTNELKAKLDNAGKQEDIDKLKAENQKQADQINYLDKTLTRAEASGENINIKNSAEYPISNISIDTNIKQDSREGYNEIDTTEFTEGESNGVKLTKNEDGTIVLNGTSTGDALFRILRTEKSILATETEKIVINQISGTVSGTVQFVAQDTNYGNIAVARIGTATVQGTLVKDITYNTFAITVASGTVCNNLKLGLVISSGKTEYEQYGSMPSIEFSSEIKTPVGKQEVYAGNKNLAYNVEYHQNNTTANSYLVKANYKIIEGCYYKISWKCNVDNQFITVNKGEKYGFERINLPNGVVVGKENAVILKAIKSGTFEQIQLLARSTYLFDSSITVFCSDFVLEKIEATNDSEALAQKTFTNYIEHQSQVQDIDVGELLGPIVDKEDGSYFENRYGKYTVTGDETWRVENNNTRLDVYNMPFVSTNNTEDTQYCNYVKTGSAGAYSPNTFWVGINNIRIYNDWKFTNADEVKAKFKELYANGTPLEFVFPLATPTYTKLTDEQQAQWNKIKKMHTYEGVTNIYTINENGISPVINMKYVKSPKVVEENLQAQIDKLKNSIISMGGNV